mmetsp:Transcript_9994/g.15089  ORF Transcript_9994/g.15089 Transcript_9994/m.15089 type:complete len:130 (-) Transcript_9994:405-794(-)
MRSIIGDENIDILAVIDMPVTEIRNIQMDILGGLHVIGKATETTARIPWAVIYTLPVLGVTGDGMRAMVDMKVYPVILDMPGDVREMVDTRAIPEILVKDGDEMSGGIPTHTGDIRVVKGKHKHFKSYV